MSDDKLTGKFGEQLAKEHLVSNKYKIVEQNFRTRTGEIDIIAEKDKTLVFVEVKTRVGKKFGLPYEAVGFYKMNHLKKASTYYLMLHNYPNMKYRFDVISIILNEDKSVESLKHFENIL